MKAARVVLWTACPRDCELCCNKLDALDSAVRIRDISEVTGYDEVILTGGEPMLNPQRAADAALAARHNNPGCKVYIYTALWHYELGVYVNLFDGVTYSVHEPLDYSGFLRVQLLAEQAPNVSWRLYLSPDVDTSLPIIPSIWDEIKSKPWLDPCPVPKHETLYLLGNE